MNLTKESEEMEGVYSEKNTKIKPSFIIDKDIEFVGGPERNGDSFIYKFKAISPRAIKYFNKKYKSETKRS
jgi:hypothetical protein